MERGRDLERSVASESRRAIVWSIGMFFQNNNQTRINNVEDERVEMTKQCRIPIKRESQPSIGN